MPARSWRGTMARCLAETGLQQGCEDVDLLEQATARVHELEAEQAALITEHVRVENEASQIRRRVKLARRDTDANELAGLLTRQRELESLLEGLKARLRDSVAALERARSRRTALWARARSLERQLREAEDQVRHWGGQVSWAESEAARFGRLRDEAERKVAKLRRDLAALAGLVPRPAVDGSHGGE